MQIPWVADGPDTHEQPILDSIVDAAALDPDLARNLISHHWIRDPATALHADIVAAIADIAKSDVSLSREIVEMPFLYQPSHADVIALQAILDLLHTRRIVALTQSPIYRQGISDEHAPMMAAAAGGQGTATQRYLRLQGVYAETRTFEDAVPPITITVMRRKGASADPNTLRHIREAATALEAVIGHQLPRRHIVVAFDPSLVDITDPATHHRNLIAIRDERVKASPPDRLHTLYREIARYWWHGNANWIDEGVAQTLANTASRANNAPWLARPLPRQQCQVPNIKSLDQDAAHTARAAQHCSRYLGEALFRDLQTSLHPDTFAQAIRQILKHRPAGIAHVKQAFPNQHATIDHHYHGDRNAPHRWRPDDTVSANHHDAVSWSLKPSHHQRTIRFSGTITPPAIMAPAAIAFTISDHQRRIAYILPPQEAQTDPEQDSRDIAADRFSIAGNTFDVTFNWPPGTGTPEGKTITVWGYRDAARVPVIGEHTDPLAISVIRDDHAASAPAHPPSYTIPTPVLDTPTPGHATPLPKTPTATTPTPTTLQGRLQRPTHATLLALPAGTATTVRGCHLGPDKTARRFNLVTWDIWEPHRFGKELNIIRIMTKNGQSIPLTRGVCYQVPAAKHVTADDGYICLDPLADSPQQEPCQDSREDLPVPIFILDTTQHHMRTIR